MSRNRNLLTYTLFLMKHNTDPKDQNKPYVTVTTHVSPVLRPEVVSDPSVGAGAEARVSVPVPVLDLQVYELTETILTLTPVCFQMQLHYEGTSVLP